MKLFFSCLFTFLMRAASSSSVANVTDNPSGMPEGNLSNGFGGLGSIGCFSGGWSFFSSASGLSADAGRLLVVEIVMEGTGCSFGCGGDGDDAGMVIVADGGDVLPPLALRSFSMFCR